MTYKGLSDDDVKASRKRHGANIQQSGNHGSLLIIKEVIKEPMVILLLIACLFYFVMQQYQEGIIMAIAIVIVSGISIYQQVRSENALKALNKLTQQLSIVIRNNQQIEIPSEELVVGDVMLVNEGQQVGADAEILELNDLSVDESILTGESFPVEKTVLGEKIFSGSTVNTGMAWAKVTSVGNKTKIGLMGKVMEETTKGKTSLQIQVANFVKQMALFGVAAFLFVWLYNFIESGEALKSLMQGLTLAMAVLPEEIPVALTTFMAIGAYRMSKHFILAKHPQTVEALGAATVICVDKTGTITENKMQVSSIFDFKSDVLIGQSDSIHSNSSKELLLIALLASEEDPFDPMERAIHEKFNASIATEYKYFKTKEYPLSGMHPMMTHVYENANGKRIIACKGAPEGIIAKSELTSESIQLINTQLKRLASEGYRVLAIAKGIHPEQNLPETQDEFRFEFLGLLALSDPPRKNIPEVIQEFYNLGIDVKMITGDYPETAMSIAKQINLKNSDKVITGADIESFSEDQLKDALKTTSIFARVKPDQKLHLINALKSTGEVVAMTGDGVNDGPALKAAHIGIAMGKRGSEVARIASSLILTNDDLSNMVKAVIFGRNIYSNLKKAIQYIISIHIPLISIVTLPLILGWKFPNLFSPVHIIFLELIMGPTCSIVYENEPMDEKLKKAKPRKRIESLFTWTELSKSVIQGLAITGGLMGLMYYLIELNSSEIHVRTMVFSALVLCNIILTLTGRSNEKSLLVTMRHKNIFIPIAISITMLLLVMSLYFAPAMGIFEFESISIIDLILCGIVALLSVLWIEVYKLMKI